MAHIRLATLLLAVSWWLSLGAAHAALLVSNVNDGGPGSLRQAILDANSRPGSDDIEFAIPGTAPFRIQPRSSLPTITGPVILDACSQPGFVDRPIVELNGALAPLQVFGLTLINNGSTIRGLVINGFSRAAIYAQNGGHHTIETNFLGTDVTGTIGVPNAGAMWLANSLSNRVSHNVISGNTLVGIELAGALTRGTRVEGNLIGTDVTGTSALPNTGPGVLIDFGSSFNVLGGLTSEARNVISGHDVFAGVEIVHAGSRSNVLQGNFIGTDVTGTEAIANGTGVLIGFSAADNLIGGTDSGARNVISGNSPYDGVQCRSSASRTSVIGNFIGVDVTGTRALGNAQVGIQLSEGGDHVVGPGNVIAANGHSGIHIQTGASRTSVVGNLIGTDVTGQVALGNNKFGIGLLDVPDCTIGGTDETDRNVISANNFAGIVIEGSLSTRTEVLGNYIGTDATGTNALGNRENGIFLFRASNNTIGGTTPGAGNVISANGFFARPDDGSSGLELWDGASGNSIQGNIIGLDATGTVPMGNFEHGIFIQDSANNVINSANVVSGNGANGIYVQRSSSSRTTIQGNLIGLDATGAHAVANDANGLHLENSPNAIIGGPGAAGRNIISGNGLAGVLIEHASAINNILRNNFIGTDLSGTSAVGNGEGIHIRAGASQNTLGFSNPNGANLISGNRLNGVHLENAPTTDNTLLGNIIGADVTGTLPLGNQASGVRTSRGASSNTIGTGNTIAFNGAHGVWLRDGSGNQIRANSIFGNDGLGINLGLDAVTLNDPGDADTGANHLQNYPVLTRARSQPAGTLSVDGSLDSQPNTAYLVEFFSSPVCDPSGFGQGQVVLGNVNVTTDGSGQATFSLTLSNPGPSSAFVTATASDPDGNTSEFSACAPSVFRIVMDCSEDGMSLEWPEEEGLDLQCATNLVPPILWLTVSEGIETADATNCYEVEISEGAKFFRLIKP